MRVKKVNVKMWVRVRMRTWVMMGVTTVVPATVVPTTMSHAATACQRQIRHHEGAEHERQQHRKNDSISENSFDHLENPLGAPGAK